ncbi:hypothetical protein KVR01_003958 [Diaporthe batatas]|uniref:uncharacterized protein n=1 Tax=Diaporthe batatas TaxID=748121 RepID=UPI001D0490FB|nr:uncharacterized protein KVR01_003958 [Diaporthe batatas]KAG8168269.1 hypothetical protein KVR01_003958 [Diaporthe batatas]
MNMAESIGNGLWYAEQQKGGFGDGKNFFVCLLENFKWMILLAIFLGGLSLHVSQAILCHMFGIEMTWGATSKEAEFSNFWIEVPRVIKKVCHRLVAQANANHPQHSLPTRERTSSSRS